MDKNIPAIPKGFKQPIQPDDTDQQEQKMLEWTRSISGKVTPTDDEQTVLDAIKERRKKNGA